jgi:5-(carboxyamino)imidazole ribonucleotide synthase
MVVKIVIQGQEHFVSGLSLGPHESGQWTIDGSRTSQFEQHLRAILDLPLGDPSMTSEHAVAGNIFGSNQRNMYRPYLHLMARSPALKIYHYRQEGGAGSWLGHVTAVGDDLLDLQESVAHAVNYMSGVIDE